MFLGSFENQVEQSGENNFGLLEKSHYLSDIRSNEGLYAPGFANNFQEVFLTNFAPNYSTLSICTKTDHSYETFSICDEFFGESVDCFLADNPFSQAQNSQNGEAAGQKVSILEQNFVPEKKSQQKLQLIGEDLEKQQQDLNCHDQTKNIPKNYIKAIFAFILQNGEYVEKLLNSLSENVSINTFIDFVKGQKKTKKYTIERLKNLWTHGENGKAMRIISCEFLRKRSLSYIFGSKIEKKLSHIKHRYKFMKSIENPAGFTNIK